MSIVVAGVALGGTTSGTTVTAIVEGQPGRTPRVRLLDRDADGRRMPRRPEARRLVRALEAEEVQRVAIDAPLSLPRPVVCEDEDSVRCFPDDGSDADYLSRSCDSFVPWSAAGYVSAHPLPPARLGALAFRGIYLRRALERAGNEVVEAWPRGVYMALEAQGSSTLSGSTEEPEAYLAGATALLAPRLEFDSLLSTTDEVYAVAARTRSVGPRHGLALDARGRRRQHLSLRRRDTRNRQRSVGRVSCARALGRVAGSPVRPDR